MNLLLLWARVLELSMFRRIIINSLQNINAQFGIPQQLSFRENENGIAIADVSNAYAKASLSLQGAHLLSWQPHTQTVPVIWMSRDARIEPGKSIRGGVPVCWPWFGPHASSKTEPAHGFVRTSLWQVVGSGVEPNGATRLSLRWTQASDEKASWPYACELTLTVIFGESLQITLETNNTGNDAFVISEALHTYFHISDISQIQLLGLEGQRYWDTVGGGAVSKVQAGELSFTEETDRVYVNSLATCTIEDRRLQRKIIITKSGSQTTVVWNPWVDKANRMGDLGRPDGWRGMLCVESANAWDNKLTIEPAAKHVLSVNYIVESV